MCRLTIAGAALQADVLESGFKSGPSLFEGRELHSITMGSAHKCTAQRNKNADRSYRHKALCLLCH